MQKLSKKKIERIVKEVKTKGYSIIPNLISKKSCKFFCELLDNDYKRYSKFYGDLVGLKRIVFKQKLMKNQFLIYIIKILVGLNYLITL